MLARRSPDDRRTPAETRQVALGGRRLMVADWPATAANAPDSIPLLFLAGIGMNFEMIEPVVQAMPGRRVISLDMPGIGGSPDAVLPYTIPAMALILALLLDELGIETVDVAGMSWGGALAQQFAFQHRARVRKLALVATGAGATMLPGNPVMLRELLDPTQWTRERPLRRTLAMLYGGGSHEPVSLNAAKPPTPWGWTCQLSAFALWSSLPFLPLLDLPVLVMADDDDQIIPPANSQVLANLIPRARLVTFHQGGHLFLLAQTARFVAELESFLDGD